MEAIQKQQAQTDEAAKQKRGIDEETSKKMEDLMKTNQSLSETISNVEERNRQLQTKVSTVKIYQRVFKHAISMQCKFCNIFFPAEVFIDHVKTCTKDCAG